MSSDWMREHKDTNATKGGAPIEGCSCCLQVKRKWFRFVNVTGRFPMTSDWVSGHKEINTTNEGVSMVGCL